MGVKLCHAASRTLLDFNDGAEDNIWIYARYKLMGGDYA
jgi:hypothetical protein